MENINLVLQNYLLLVIIVLLALVIMLYVMYKGQKKELQALKEKYDFFTQGDNVNCYRRCWRGFRHGQRKCSHLDNVR